MIYKALTELEAQNQAGVLCTIIHSQGSTPRHTTSKMIVYPDKRLFGSIGGGELENRVIAEALAALEDGKTRLLQYNMNDPSRGDPGVCGGKVVIFVEPILPKPTLVIIGTGHVGKAVAHLAHWLGFWVAASDDRPEFCNPEAVPDADVFYPVPLSELSQLIKVNSWTYIVLTTRGLDVDIAGLPGLLDTPAAYIGIIGSKRRWLTTRQHLMETGVPEAKLDRVNSPIGLELNAETPEEIAVSIMAEIIMLRNGGSGKIMKLET